MLLKSYLFFIFTFIITSLYADEFDHIRINEILANNTHIYIDPESKNFEDVIEIYNVGETMVNLNGLYLSDNFNTPLKWRIRENININPKGFFVFIAEGSGTGSYPNFQLSDQGEEIGLFRQDGSPVDTMTFGKQLTDISFGRFPDGGSERQFFTEPTFGKANGSQGTTIPQRTSRPEFLPGGGMYAGSQSVTMTVPAAVTIHYTKDGSYPDSFSPVYTEPVVIGTTTVLRAVSYEAGFLPSRTETHTYVIAEETHLPVISIATDPDYLYDNDIGITIGQNVDPAIGAEPPFDQDANFWQDWERPISFEYYKPGGELGFSLDAGIMVFGGAFGRQIPQKAFTVFMRNKYGENEIDYQLFSSKPISRFKRFVLRASSNDYNRTFMRDAMMNTLTIGMMEVDYQADEPVLGFINGQYWGIYHIREKMNEYYVESNYGIDTDNVDLLENLGNVIHGNSVHYQNLINFIQNNDISQSDNYNYVLSQMDINEYMNYMIAQIYFRNHDWMHRNVKYWREQSPEGKWRWMLFDLDWGFGGEIREGPDQYTTNSLNWALAQGEASVLFSRLLENEAFRQSFAQRFASHLNLTFHPDRVLSVIDSLKEKLEPLMPRHIERWGVPENISVWEEQVNILRTFATYRPDYVRSHIQTSLSLNDMVSLTLEIEPSGTGVIYVHEVPATQDGFTGLFYQGIPVCLEAVPHYGYRFVHWEGISDVNIDSISIILDDSAGIRALFQPVDIPSVVINEIHYNPSADLQGDDDNFEFIELYNWDDSAVDISNYTFNDGIVFTFPPGTSIGSDEYIVIAMNMGTYQNQGYQVFPFTSGRLANEGEQIVLTDGLGRRVDSVRYNDRVPWPTEPDGDGPSLELVSPFLDNVLPESWRASELIGGTPGRSNGSAAVGKERQHPCDFTVYSNFPNPFNGETIIGFDLPFEDCVFITVYNILGQKIHQVNQQYRSGYHTWTWDARNDLGQMVESGIYFYEIKADRHHGMGKMLFVK